ncbi:hypothetical protein Cgig2_016433 [Carnegiea gigantea]|uniref:Uncharacterized protein n=1 Tax=Carnegiea gigantea TaxID=171969 RepID=A0A9Q1K5X7_9CARY|nr:hypothetical protein Cgig2_016433 [Carnegiea gigantea]
MVLDFELPKMVQGTFYLMLLHDAVELGTMSGFLAVDLKLTLEGLRWISFEAWLTCERRDFDSEPYCQKPADQRTTRRRAQDQPAPCLLPRPKPFLVDYPGLCPGFDLGVATWYAQDSNIPEMLQAIFYAMVLDWEPFKFWLENVDSKLRSARASRPVNPPADLASSSGPVEASGLNDAPPASSDEE